MMASPKTDFLKGFLEIGKVPYYIREHEGNTILTILDKKGLHAYYNGVEGFFKPLDKVNDDDVSVLFEKVLEWNRWLKPPRPSYDRKHEKIREGEKNR